MTIHLDSFVRIGSVLQFAYPIDNRFGVSTRLRRRQFVIETIRDTEREPIEQWAIDLRPDLRRGPILVTGHDLESKLERSFYLSSARSIRPVEIELKRLAYFDPLNSSVPLRFFGSIYTNCVTDSRRAHDVIDQLNSWSAPRPRSKLAVALHPWSPRRMAS